MKLCGCVNWCRIGWLIVVLNLLFLPNFTFSQNLPPVLDIGVTNQHAEVGSAFLYTIPSNTFKDENNQSISYNVSGLPAGLFYNSSTRQISGTPTTAGTSTVNVSGSDGSSTQFTSFTLYVHASGSTYAAFTMNTQMGCNYRLVSFKSISEGAGNIRWVFGDGNDPVDNIDSPARIYSTPGAYTVTLIINPGLPNEDSHSEIIRIFPRPSPGIAPVTSTGCEPLDLTLSANGAPVSVPATVINGQTVGAITGGSDMYHYWYFFEQHPAIYNTNLPDIQVNDLADGFYNVMLEVTDENGCQGSIVSNNLFEVYDRPDAYFSYEKSNNCEPSPTQFINKSNVNNSILTNSNWNINNQPLADHNDTVSFNFTNFGNFEVTLQTSSQRGCVSNIYRDTIRFNNNNSADFVMNNTYCLGDTVNLVASTSAGAITYAWDLNNNGSVESHTAAFSHVFTNPGEYPIKLTVGFNDDCQIVVSKTITVDQVAADFNSTAQYSCSNNNYPVSFSSISSSFLGRNIASTNWYLVDGSSQTFLSSAASFSRTFTDAGTINIRLDVVSANGCIASVTKQVQLQQPTVTIQVSGATSGCLPAGATNFQADFYSLYETPLSYSWNFGDTGTGTWANTSHVYLNTGSFQVSVTVNTSSGCSYTSTRNNAVQLTDQPIISSVILNQDPDYCFSLGADLNVSYSAGTENLYFITPNGTDHISDPGVSPFSYHYDFPDTGLFSIDVYSSRFGCLSDTITLSNIRASEPRASFSTLQTTFCDDPPYDAAFINNSSYSDPATQFHWDFGDGTTSTDVSPNHQFLTTGNYPVSLTVTNPNTGCTDNFTSEINIFSFDDAPGIITSDVTSGCAPLTVNFSQTISGRLSANYQVSGYHWDFDNDGAIDSTTLLPNIQHTYYTPKQYSVRLMVTSANGCDYVFTKPSMISASGPVVGFTHFPAQACLNSNVIFTNTTTQPGFDTADPTNNIYFWDFGDGTTSTLQNPVHAFTTDSVFSVSLTVTDENSCSATLEKPNLIQIIPFEPLFALDDTIFCNNEALTFENLSTGQISSFRWDFDGDTNFDLTTFNTNAVQHPYTTSGNYTIVLETLAINGCTKTTTSDIRVVNATANFSASSTNIGCAPAFAYFQPETEAEDVISYLWTFGDGNRSNERSPKNYYVIPGKYTVSLEIRFKGGCSKTVTKTEYITADGAYGVFNYDKTLGCAPNPVLFSASELNRVTYIDWDFGTGTIERDTLPSSSTSYMETTFVYDTLGFRLPKIILTDLVCGAYAYENLSKGSIYTSTPPVPGYFVDFDSICRGVEIQFTDSSKSFDPLYQVNGWKWDFGTSAQDSSKIQNPKFKYQNQGVFSPQLIVTNELGCSDTLRKSNSIHIYSNELLTSAFDISDQLACPWQAITFTSQAEAGTESSISKYEWNFGNGFITRPDITTNAFHDSLKGRTINIIHRVTDDKFCIDSTIRTVAINHLQAAFGYDPQPVFRGSLVDFTDQSASDFSTTVTGWSWNFENGSPLSSTAQNPQDIGYSTIADENDVRLIVTNSNNCKDTLVVSFDVLNNPPEVEAFTITMVENHDYVFKRSEFESKFDPADPAQTIVSIRVESAPANGSFLLNGTPYSIGTSIPISQISLLKFIPATDWNGNTQFQWNGFDGVDWSNNPEWVYVIVLEEPDPPLLSDIVFNLPEDANVQITQQDFIDHVYSVLGSSFVFDSLRILTNLSPAVGTFTFNGDPVNAPMLILENQINNSDSIFEYIPTAGYNGTLSLNWNVYDGYNFADFPARVIINYYNTAPDLTDIIRTGIKEDQFQIISKADFTAHYSDVDLHDSPQQFYLTNLPPVSEGTFWYNGQRITLNNFSVPYSQFNAIRFDPTFGFEGSTQVTWGISDGTDIGWALLQFTFVNTPPVAHNFTVTGFEDVTRAFTLTDFEHPNSEFPFEDDDAWDLLRMISIQSLPANGTLTFNGSAVSIGQNINRSDIGLLTYLSNPDWYGTDAFNYNAFDGTNWAANDATVFLTIQPVNDAPRPRPDFYTIQEDQQLSAVPVGINDTDIDDLHTVLSFRVETQDSASAGEFGTIQLNQLGYLTYTPNTNFYGSVYFLYTVCDDDFACAKDTVFITVQPENDAPVALKDTFIIYEDEVSKIFNCITNNDYDVDGDAISLMEVETDLSGFIATAYGNLNWNSQGDITFTLASGLDTLAANERVDLEFDYLINDSWSATGSSVFLIRIVGRNNAPVAVADEYNTYEGVPSIFNDGIEYQSILFNDSDPENDPHQVYTVNNGVSRTIVGNYGTFIWSANGSWTFNQNLEATDSLYQNEYVELIYPYTNFDGVTASDPSVITINIIGVNDAPVANDNYLEIFEDVISITIDTNQPEALLSNDSDVDGDDFSVISVEGSTSQTVTGDVGILNWSPDGSYTYTPDRDSVQQLAEGQSITDIFTYVILDDFGASDTARLIINIMGKNDAPFAQDDFLTIYEDTHITVVDSTQGLLVNDGDIDHDPIVVAVNGVGTRTLHGTFGTLTWESSGAYTYVTDIDIVDTLYQGEEVQDIFTYMVNDPSGETDMAVLTITIIGENDAPVAVNHTDSIGEDDPPLTISNRGEGILNDDFDIDDQQNFGIISIDQQNNSPVIGLYGELEWNYDGTFTYTLNPETDTLSNLEMVVDSFRYVIQDIFDSTGVAWFFIVITGENDNPVAQNDTLRLTEDILKLTPTWTLLDNDADTDGDPIALFSMNNDPESPTPTKFANFDWINNGAFTYNRHVHPNVFNGLDTLAFDDLIFDSIAYTIIDEHGIFSESKLILQIRGMNDRPVASRDINFINETSVSVSSDINNHLLANDRDVDRRDSIMLLRIKGETDYSTEGIFGWLTWNDDGSYTYFNRFESTDSLAQMERVHDLFPYTIVDRQGATTTDTLDITIIGSNDKPVAVNDTVFINEDERMISIYPENNGVMWNDYDVDGDVLVVKLPNADTTQTFTGIYGQLTLWTDGRATYQLNAETDTLYYGEMVSDQFNYTITDVYNATSNGIVVIHITGENDWPVASDEFISIDEDTDSVVALAGTADALLYNDSDIDGDALIVYSVNDSTLTTVPGNYGELVWDSTGAYHYITDKVRADRLAFGDTVQEVFPYTIHDPFGGSDTAQLIIEITGVNDPPVALANFYITRDVVAIEVAPADTNVIVYNDYDVDGEIQIVTQVNNLPNNTTNGQWGALIWNSDGSFIYLPDSANAIALRPDESNIDQFIYTIEDEWGATDTSTINFTIEGINNGPVAYNDTIFLMEDDLFAEFENLLENDEDPDRDSLLVARMENDTTGIMTGFYGAVSWQPNGHVVFTPNRYIIDQLGHDDIVTEVYNYTIIDEGGLKDSADLIIYIIGQNDPVKAKNDSASLSEDSYVLVDVMANDVDVDNNYAGNWAKSPVTIMIPPQNGQAFVNSFNGVISYFPDKNFNGPDSLLYRVCDDEGSCDQAWVYFDVVPVNDPPVATHLILKTNVNTPVDFNAFDQVEDIDDGINPASMQYPNGNLTLKDSIFTYTPDVDFIGHDEFIYSLADFEGKRAYVIVTVLIPDGGDGAQDDLISTNENTPVKFKVLDNDTLNGFVANPLSLDIKIFPVNGVAAYDPFTQLILYQPTFNYNGTDQLTYMVSSESGIWDFATVYIAVEPVNSPIEANDDARTTLINQTLNIAVLQNDVDEDNGIDRSSLVILQPTTNGSLSYNSINGIVTYVPNPVYKGPDQFTYRVCDLDPFNPSCDSATVFILVKSKFDDLQAGNDTIGTMENTPVTIRYIDLISNDEVGEGTIDFSSFTILSVPQHGSYELDETTNNLVYTPFDNYFGPDWMTYRICDNDTSCDMAEINIWVEEVNTAPVAGDDYYMVTDNTTKRLYVLSNDFDYDGTLNWQSLAIITEPKNGSYEIDEKTGTLLYTPSVNANTDVFIYEICDNDGDCSQGTVNISIDLGSTILYNIITDEDTPYTLNLDSLLRTRNFNDAIENYTEVIVPEVGSWEFANNYTDLIYTPMHDSTGSDYFNIMLYFPGPDTADLKVTVTIIPVNDAPVAWPDTIVWPTGMDSMTIAFNDLLWNDYDVDGDSILLIQEIVESGDSLHFIFNSDSSTITIWADTIFWCDAWFNYQVYDYVSDSFIVTGKALIFPTLNPYFAQNDTIWVDENNSANNTNIVDIPILENDIIKDNQLCTIDTAFINKFPPNGVAEMTVLNTILYRPTDHFFGIDSLQYYLIDIWGQTDSAWVIINVNERNVPPVAEDDTPPYYPGEELVITVLDNDYDPDPDGWIDTLRTQWVEPKFGTVSFNADSGYFVYTPFAFTCEADQFTYTILDNEGDSASATVVIGLPAEAPLFAVTDTVRTWPGVPVEFNVLSNDRGYFLPYIETGDYTHPQFGTVEQTGDSTFMFYPDYDFMGRDSMTYQLVSPCDNQATGYVIFLIEELKVPEIITPNNDTKNDVLIIDGIQYFPDAMLQIFNRYGHVVYQRKGYENDWGGYSNQGSLGGNKPLPSGTYYYTLIYNEGRNRQAGLIYIYR